MRNIIFRFIFVCVVSYVILVCVLFIFTTYFYNVKMYNYAITTSNIVDTIFIDTNYTKLKKAQSAYYLNDYKLSESYINSYTNSDDENYNTLKGHLNLINNNYSDAKKFYIKSIDSEYKLYKLTHLMQTCLDKECITTYISKYYDSNRFSDESIENRTSFINNIYKLYFGDNYKDYIISYDNFKLADLTNNEIYNSYKDDLDKLNELLYSKEFNSVSYADINDLIDNIEYKNNDSYLLIVGNRYNKDVNKIDNLDFDLISREIKYLVDNKNEEYALNIIDNYIKLDNKLDTTSLDYLNAYKAVIIYSTTYNEKDISNILKNIKDKEILKDTNNRIEMIDITKYYKTNGLNDTIDKYGLSKEEIEKIVDDFKRGTIFWENLYEEIY